MAQRELDLDVVRGLAIVLAMGWHFNAVPLNPWVDWALWPGRALGWAGVDLFFILSGFLVGRLLFQEYERSGTFEARRFLVRRAFKLWPILYIFLFAMSFSVPWQSYLLQIGTHTQNYFRTPVATHLWSLAVEEHFYLAFAILFPLWIRHSRHDGVVALSLLGIVVAAPVLRVVGALSAMNPVDVQVQTQFRADALAFGVLLALVCVKRPGQWSRIVRLKPLWMLLAVVFYGALLTMPKNTFAGMTIGFTLSYLAGACLMLSIYKSGVENRMPLLSRGLAFMGVYSYAMYIWHVPAARAVEALARKVPGCPHELVVLACYASAVIVAWVFTRLIEKPFLRLRDRLFPAYSPQMDQARRPVSGEVVEPIRRAA